MARLHFIYSEHDQYNVVATSSRLFHADLSTRSRHLSNIWNKNFVEGVAAFIGNVSLNRFGRFFRPFNPFESNTPALCTVTVYIDLVADLAKSRL